MATHNSEAYGLAEPQMLQKIDKLFACGVGELVNLPQIVVVGDQSSGKSSVLEGLIKKPLPRDSGLCTRFATHIVFRRAAEERIVVSIKPDRRASSEHRNRIRAWNINSFFGWTGAALSINTACSSSAVAIDQACKALIGNEYFAAVAGGVNIITSSRRYDDLDKAGLLSHTGQCKPFDMKADGYCQGEAVGMLFLKRLSVAIEEGDLVWGVINASTSSQAFKGDEKTSTALAEQRSHVRIFRKVLEQARIAPNSVSYVEAHGAGIQDGDASEYHSLQEAFTDSRRRDKLFIGSIKGVVGHGEAAAGVTGCIKVLAMLHERTIPAQQSFGKLSTKINNTRKEVLKISSSTVPWNNAIRVALVNSFGVSGSLSALVLSQPPQSSAGENQSTPRRKRLCSYPFRIHASSERQMGDCFANLLDFLEKEDLSKSHLSLRNLSYNICQQNDISLRSLVAFDCTTVEELKEMAQIVF